jgi:hypothetical protein
VRVVQVRVQVQPRFSRLFETLVGIVIVSCIALHQKAVDRTDHRYDRLRGSISTRCSIERSEKERVGPFPLVGCTLSLLRRNELGTAVAESIPRH